MNFMQPVCFIVLVSRRGFGGCQIVSDLYLCSCDSSRLTSASRTGVGDDVETVETVFTFAAIP